MNFLKFSLGLLGLAITSFNYTGGKDELVGVGLKHFISDFQQHN